MIVKMRMMKIFSFRPSRVLVTGILSGLFYTQVAVAENVAATASADEPLSGWFLSAEQWEVSRSGDRILQIPVLKTIMNNWIQGYENEHDLFIELRYPGGEEGELWVQELADWLVALGVPSQTILMVPGSGADDMIKLALVRVR